MSSVLHVIIAADPPGRLDKALARDVPEEAHLSRSRLARLIGRGAVALDGITLTDPSRRVEEGARITIRLEDASPTHIGAEAIALDIIHEDDDLLVIDKPAGMVVHPAPGSPVGTLVNALLHHLGDSLSGVGGVRRPGIVHRIDKDTSGLLVVAKTDAAHHGLAAQFAAHSAERSYIAVCHGVRRRPIPVSLVSPGWAGSREQLCGSPPGWIGIAATGSGRRWSSGPAGTPSLACGSNATWVRRLWCAPA